MDKGLGTKHHSGGAAGIRVTENFWRYIGLEQAFASSSNNVSFLKPAVAGQPNFSFGNRIYQYSLNPIIYFTPRGSKIPPVTAGISALNYNPTDTGTANARLITDCPFGAKNLDDDLKPGLNYGGG